MGNNILQLAMNKDDLNSQYPFYSLNLNSKTSCGFIFLPVTMVLIFSLPYRNTERSDNVISTLPRLTGETILYKYIIHNN